MFRSFIKIGIKNKKFWWISTKDFPRRGNCVMMWPAQTVGHILFTILFLGPDDVTWRNEPSRSQNTSAILEAPLQPTIFATSPPVSLLPGSQMRLKNYLNSFAKAMNQIE